MTFRASLGTVLVGAGVLASCNVAGAAPRAYGDPEIAKVNGVSAYSSTGGVDRFQTDDWNVGIWVNPSHGGLGDLTVRDTGSGDVLCELPERALEALADCPAFLGPGEHRVVGEITKDGVTRTTAPVVIESYAPEIPAAGVAPESVTVVGTSPGDSGGATAVTLQGTPGDRVILRDTIYDTVLDTTLDATGRATAQVYLAEGVTAQLPVESQRDGRRWTGSVPVTADPKPYTHAEPLQLIAVEQAADGTRTVVLRGTPGAWYELQTANSTERLDGTVPEDGIVRRQVHGGEAMLHFSTHGDDREQESGWIDLTAPPTGGGGEDGGNEDGQQPVDPVVAQPDPGAEDPGFTLPIVAQPGPGEVDPGFTAPGEQATAAVTLVSVEPTRTAGVARVTVQGEAGDSFELHTTTGRFWFSGVLDEAGHASFDVWDFPNGEQRTFTGVVSHNGVEREFSFTATSTARTPVTAEPLEYVGTEQTDAGTVATFRGTPGARYSLGTSGNTVQGDVPADGLVRWTGRIAEGQTARLYWTTSAEAGWYEGSRLVAGPGVDDREPGQISVVEVGAASAADVARVTIAGQAGDRVELSGGSFWWSGQLDDQGRATFDVWGFPNGEERTFRGTVSRGTHSATAEISVTSAARQPVHAEALEHVGTAFTDHGAVVTFRGTPGAWYQFGGRGTGASYGTIPEDGLVRYTLFLDDSGAGELWWQTIGDDHRSEQGTVRVQQPITADPAPGIVDPGFTVPGDDTGEPGDGGDTGQPGDGGDTGQPGDEDGTPATDVSAEIVVTSAVTKRGVLRVQDRSLAPYESYYAGVFLDGKQTDAVRVTGTSRDETIGTGGAGSHVLELRKDGKVLAKVEYTVPDTSSSADPTDQFATALVGVDPVTKRVSYTVQDTGLADPLDRYLVGVWVDGHQVAATSVDRTLRTDQFAGGDPGTHSLELRAKDGHVLGGFEYTVPGTNA
ncbi:hypothetical protein NS263_02455 [Curtobacterium oceanosedimentum]|uniref:Bacterial Ig domain-containing protein n=1 Tax=Curtobacterium oceanosedimentum TaxID=465820 RepID=A0ABR5S994_9MICO|nr:hypothetical protein NS263_02455 [Curtobacterium oceanosedimentum]